MNVQKIQHMLFLLTIFLLPTQFGKHFWPAFATVNGIRIDYLSPTLYTTDLLIVLLFGLQLYQHIVSSAHKTIRLNQTSHLTKIFLAIGLCILLLGCLNSASLQLSVLGLIKLGECAFFSWYVCHRLTTTQAKIQTLTAFSLGMLGESLLAIAQWINHGSIGGLLYYLGERSFTTDTPGIANASINGTLMLRPYATLPHPNVLAGYLLLGIAIVVPVLGHVSSQKRYSMAVLIISSLGLLVTLSRVTIILWCLLTTLLVLDRRTGNSTGPRGPIRWQWRYWVMGIAILILLFSLTPVGPRFLQTSSREESVVQRQQLILASFRMLADHSLMGVGFHAFLPSLPPYLPAIGPQVPLQPVHNILLLIAAETGLLGEFIATYFYAKALIRSYNKSWNNMLILILIFILGMTDHYFLTVQQGQLLLAFGVGYALSAV